MARSSDKLSTRKNILKAARKLFFERGFSGTTTMEIAKQASVAEGTVFNHFKNKNNLLLALTEEVDIDEIAQVIEYASQQGTQELFKDYLLKHKQIIQKNSDILTVLLYESRFNEKLQDKFISEVGVKIIQPLENLVKQKVIQGEFQERNPQITARAFLGMLLPFIAWQKVFNADQHGHEYFDNLSVIEELVDLFLLGAKVR